MSSGRKRGVGLPTVELPLVELPPVGHALSEGEIRREQGALLREVEEFGGGRKERGITREEVEGLERVGVGVLELGKETGVTFGAQQFSTIDTRTTERTTKKKKSRTKTKTKTKTTKEKRR